MNNNDKTLTTYLMVTGRLPQTSNALDKPFAAKKCHMLSTRKSNILGISLLMMAAILFTQIAAAENIVKLQSASVGRCLNVHAGRDNSEGGSVTLYDCADTRDQEWETISPNGRWIKLRNRSTQRCLNIHGGSQNREGGLISVYSCANTPDQEWRIMTAGSHTQLKNRSTGRCLNVHKGRHNYNGAPATAYSCANSVDQKWTMSTIGDDGAIGSVSSQLVAATRDINTPRRNATIRIERPQAAGQARGVLQCSGVLISPTIVLSAGHCWDPSPRPRVPGVPAFGPSDWETPGDWYPYSGQFVVRVGSNDSQAGTIYTITQYSLAGNTDIIMFRLSNRVPRSQAIPAQVVTNNGPDINSREISNYLRGKTLRIAGWGSVSAAAQVDPRFRQTISDVVFRAWPGTVFGPNPAQLIVRSASNATIQGGDSGGPLYWDDGNTLRVLGITQGEGRHVMTFFRGGTRGAGGAQLPDLALWVNEALGREDCISFNSSRIRTQRFASNWKVIEPIPEGNHMLFDFRNSMANADTARAILRGYNINQSCYLNRPGSNFRYLLRAGNLPSGRVDGEDCTAINPASLVYNERDGRWFIETPTGRPLFAFEYTRGPNGSGGTAASRYAGFNEAHSAMTLMRQKNARFLCYVGRPNPGLIYLRQ